jgi:hypothetical protein
MMTETNNQIYEEYLESFRKLHPIAQSIIRREAAQHLRDEGFTEIGSGDISCKVYAWYRQYRNFQAMFDGLCLHLNVL